MKFDYNTFMHGWNGHWWMGGARCYDRGDMALDLFRSDWSDSVKVFSIVSKLQSIGFFMFYKEFTRMNYRHNYSGPCINKHKHRGIS